MEQTFTVQQARQLMPAVLGRASELVAARADLAELQADLRRERPSALGGLPEAKGLEARLGELVAWFPAQGIEIKSFAPLLLDFPAVPGDEPVLLCWLEGETELGWYHRLDCGFPGRRPMPASW